MSDRPLLSATLIARDEKHNIRRCFDSLWPHCDEIVLIDTGSKDGTIAAARRYATEHGDRDKLRVGKFRWCDDFAAARQAADDLATGQWFVWADMDDTVVGLDRLRQMAADATDDVRAFFCAYTYACDNDRNPVSELWRERVVRNDGTPWTGRLHEHKLFMGAGQVVKVDPQIAQWVHHRDHTQRTSDRNLRVLDKWLAEEPDNPRVISSLALEYMGCERHADAARMFERYLQAPDEPADRRCQAARHLAVMRMLLGEPARAREIGLQALAWDWHWADTHLTLAEAEQTLGRPDVALRHAQDALTIGKPDTLLIVNPLQYTAHPHALAAICLGQMGRFEDAVREAEAALAISPSYGLAVDHLPRYRAGLRRQMAVTTMLALCDVLVEAGEPMKARAALDCAPWYVADEPALIGRRGVIADLIRERAEKPLPLAPDEAADAFVARHQEIEAVAA